MAISGSSYRAISREFRYVALWNPSPREDALYPHQREARRWFSPNPFALICRLVTRGFYREHQRG